MNDKEIEAYEMGVRDEFIRNGSCCFMCPAFGCELELAEKDAKERPFRGYE